MTWTTAFGDHIIEKHIYSIWILCFYFVEIYVFVGSPLPGATFLAEPQSWLLSTRNCVPSTISTSLAPTPDRFLCFAEEKVVNMMRWWVDEDGGHGDEGGGHGDEDGGHGDVDGGHGDKDGGHGDDDGGHGDENGGQGDEDDGHGDEDVGHGYDEGVHYDEDGGDGDQDNDFSFPCKHLQVRYLFVLLWTPRVILGIDKCVCIDSMYV